MKRDKQSFLFHAFRKVAVQLTTKSLTIDFFLVCEWIIKPVLIGRGGSFALEWRKRESPNFRLVLTALNRISWERFTAMAWVFPETCWCCDVPSKIRLTRWISLLVRMLFVSAVKDLHRILGLNWKGDDVWFWLLCSKLFPRQKMKLLMLQILHDQHVPPRLKERLFLFSSHICN